MPTPIRKKRVADRLRAELSDLILQELKDPRLHLVTVTQVVIDRELEHANVFVSTVGDDARQKEVLAGLASAHGFIRRESARRLKLRRAPEIHFHWDHGPENVEHVGQLLEQLKGEAAPAADPDDSAA